MEYSIFICDNKHPMRGKLSPTEMSDFDYGKDDIQIAFDAVNNPSKMNERKLLAYLQKQEQFVRKLLTTPCTKESIHQIVKDIEDWSKTTEAEDRAKINMLFYPEQRAKRFVQNQT